MINNIKEIYNKYGVYIVLWFSILFFVISFYFLINKAVQKAEIFNKQLYTESEVIYELAKSEKIDFKKFDISKLDKTKYLLSEVSIKDILNFNDLTNSTVLKQCFANKKWSIEEKACQYHYFFHKYSDLLNTKWVIDYQVCNNIEDIFGNDSFLFNRCKFIYAVNEWAKYMNINSCNILEKTDWNKENDKFSYELCIENVVYSISWRQSTLWRYFITVKERNEENKSTLYSQIWNKYWEFVEWDVHWYEYYDYSIKEYLENSYKEYLEKKKK